MIETPLVTPLSIYTVAVPILVAIIQLFKGIVDGRWWKYAPLLSIALGLVVAVGTAQAFPLLPEPWIVVGIKGVGVGLAASGLFSGARSVTRSGA